jgi:hypothetical protein
VAGLTSPQLLALSWIGYKFNEDATVILLFFYFLHMVAIRGYKFNDDVTVILLFFYFLHMVAKTVENGIDRKR